MRQVREISGSAVEKNGVKVKLPRVTSTCLEVLLAVEQGVLMSSFARERGFSRAKASRIFARVNRLGLIRREYRTSHVVWSLTPDGSELLALFKRGLKSETSAIRKFKPLFRFHHLFFVAEIRCGSAGLSERLKEGNYMYSARRHFGGWQYSYDDATVFVSRENVWILPKPIWAECLSVALERALAVALEVAQRFEARFGVRLGFPERRLVLKRQEVALVAPELLKFVPPNYFWRGDRIHIDYSQGPVELEAHDKVFAVEDMNERVMPFFDSVAKGVLTADDLKTLRDFAETLRAVPKAVERRDIF